MQDATHFGFSFFLLSDKEVAPAAHTRIEVKHWTLSSFLCLGIKHEEQSVKSYGEQLTQLCGLNWYFPDLSALFGDKQWPQSHWTVNCVYKQTEMETAHCLFIETETLSHPQMEYLH